jgi:two pore calcium channel protein 3
MGNRQSNRAVQKGSKALNNEVTKEESAAIFMKEGKHHIPFKYHPMSKNQVTAFSYAHGRLVNSIDLVAGLVLLALAFFEDPAVYPLPVAASAVIEILMLLLLLVHSAVSFVWKGPRFFEEKKIIMKHVLIVEMLVEAFVVLARQQHHMRIMRAFRPLLFLSSKYTKKIKRVMYAMLKSFIPAVDVLILLFTFVTLFAVFGFYLFSEESQTDQYTDDLKNWYFEDFAGSWINLFILTTTANHPDVVMPANKKYFWAPLFFMLFTLICNYLLNGLLLAVVFNNFKDIDKKRSCRDYRYRRRGLRWAFREVSPNDNYREDLMKLKTFKRIMEAYKPCLKKDTQTVLAMFYALSKKVKDRLTLEEWLDLPTVWHCSSWKTKSDAGFCCGTDRCKGIALEGLRKFVDSPRLECFICFVIVVNAAFIIAETVIRTSKNISNDLLDGYEEAFLAIYTIELALKITSYGPRRYWKSVFNQFDFAVVAVGLVGQIGK